MKIVLLNSVADIKVGYQARASIKLKVKGSHKLIQGKNFGFNRSVLPRELISFSPIGNPEKYAVKKYDILFQARGSGHFACCLTGLIGKNVLVASSLYIIRVKTKQIIPEYLAWQINQSQAQIYFKAQAGATGISFVSKSILMQLKIIIPDLKTQKKTCKIISLWKKEKELMNKITLKKEKLINEVLKFEVLN